MIRVHFHRLERSELARDIVLERIGEVLREFSAQVRSEAVVTLTSEQSLSATMPDLFHVRLEATTVQGTAIDLESAAPSLFAAVETVKLALHSRLSGASVGHESRRATVRRGRVKSASSRSS